MFRRMISRARSSSDLGKSFVKLSTTRCSMAFVISSIASATLIVHPPSPVTNSLTSPLCAEDPPGHRWLGALGTARVRASASSVRQNSAIAPSPASGICHSGWTIQNQECPRRRKSVGKDIGERAFTEWLTRQATEQAAQANDSNAELIAESLWPLVRQGKLWIRSGGYVLKRGADDSSSSQRRRPSGL